jgi:subtilisin family serine protease
MNFRLFLPVVRLVLAFAFGVFPTGGSTVRAQAPAAAPAARLVTVYVELDGDPLARPTAAGPVLLGARVADTRARAVQLHARQAELQARLPALGARVTGRFTRVANALRVQLPEDRLGQLATLPGVRRVQLVRTYTRHLGVSVPFTGVPPVWSSAGGGIDGRGLRVGIIDSGIDYTHADFGGTGKVADFAANDPTRIEPGTFPTAKVVGGFDFAGDDYNPGEDAHETPVPDPDPLDCAGNGHGTHVAGIAAGFGVLAGGTTYTGEYSADLDLAGFAIGPGVAPRARLYALKVFGCEGSTTLVTDALEWAADPNGDYDFSDRLDVVNLSLGGSFGALDPEDTDVAAANRLAELGCVVVCSAGNNENIFYAVGAPGVASRALSVANSISKGSGKALQVTSPPSIAGSYYLVEGAITPALTNTGPVAGRLVYIQPNIACDPPTNAAELRGHIALIDRGTCFFADKIRRAQDAGALAVVMVNNQDTAPIPMGGDSEGLHIPSGMISKADGALLKAKLGETITVVLDAKNTIERPEFVDTLDDGSSRGPGSPGGRLKPEISAPGVNVFSAKAGAGTEGIAQTGTSMSAPLVTGAAALLRQLHPDWSVEDLKSALMNTAKPIANHLGVPYPESRMGAGRMRAAEAAATTLTAAVEPDSGAPAGPLPSPAGEVGVSFGSLVLAAPYEATRTVRVRNHGDQPVTLRIAFSNSVAQAGIEFRPADATLTVPARGSATTAVRLTANPAAFDPVPDATTAAEIGGGHDPAAALPLRSQRPALVRPPSTPRARLSTSPATPPPAPPRTSPPRPPASSCPPPQAPTPRPTSRSGSGAPPSPPTSSPW